MKTPWTLVVDPECEQSRQLAADIGKPGIRYCRVANSEDEQIASGWNDPAVFRLMGAAPELLGALKRLLSEVEHLEGSRGWRALTIARDAIDAAEQP